MSADKTAAIQPKGAWLWLQSLQWMVFFLANVIAVPIVVGAAFDLPAADISSFVQRMLLATGVATLVQLFFGHRLPLIEGSAGMWWALFLILGSMAVPGEKGLVLQQLEMGLMISGAVLLILSLMPVIGRVRKLFTPIVTGVYLVLLCVSLSGSFFKGMLGVARFGHVDLRMTLLSLLIVVLVLWISLKAKGILRSMGPFVGIALGWALFSWLGLGEKEMLEDAGAAWFAVPELFAWGAPVWDFGVVLTSVLTGVILISNVIASIVVISNTLGLEADAATYRRGVFGNGVSSLLSGPLSVVGLVPLSVSAGFIMTTGLRARLPFVIGAVLVAVSGLFPFIGQFFATLPSEVAYAALFTPFAQMISFGVRDLMGVEANNRNLLVIGISLMVGVGVMFLPPDSLNTLAPWLRNIIANGLLVGLLVCLLLEHVLFKKSDS
jgi:xanthine/uracil permease